MQYYAVLTCIIKTLFNSAQFHNLKKNFENCSQPLANVRCVFIKVTFIT